MPALTTPPSTSPDFERDLAARTGYQVAHFLELRAALLERDHLFEIDVLEHPRRVVHGAEHQVRVALAGLDQRLLDVVVDRRLARAHEARAHVDALRTEAQGRRHAAAVADAAGRDDRNLQRANRGRDQDHVRHVVLAGMTGAFEAVDADDVHARALGRERVAHRRALVHDP